MARPPHVEHDAHSVACATLNYTLPARYAPLTTGARDADLTLPSQRRPFRLSLPTTYGEAGPPPLLLHFHGWGGSLRETGTSMFHAHGITNGYVVASPLGFDDGGAQHTSWHGSGTVDSPGPAGRTCFDPQRTFAHMCYTRSCGGGCNDTCWWTTCEDSVEQVAALLSELDTSVCFDRRRVYATGFSNGGVFLYELAVSRLASSFAAFMPIVGSPHRGFDRPPSHAPAPFFGLWGRQDTTIPPMANPQTRAYTGFQPRRPLACRLADAASTTT